MDARHLKFWILKDGVPTTVRREEWAWWFEHAPAERVLAQTPIDNGIWVSTVFIGLDRYFGPDPTAPPLLYETSVFGGRLNQESRLYATRDEAERGHAEMVAKALGDDTPTPPPYDRRGD